MSIMEIIRFKQYKKYVDSYLEQTEYKNMVKENVMLNNKTGLHARPATEIAKTAMSYKSDITFLVNDKKINAKSPLMLMAAGIKSKTESVAGKDAKLTPDK